MMMILGLLGKTKVTGPTMKKVVLEQMLVKLKMKFVSIALCRQTRVRSHAITNLEKNYQDNQDVMSRLKARLESWNIHTSRV